MLSLAKYPLYILKGIQELLFLSGGLDEIRALLQATYLLLVQEERFYGIRWISENAKCITLYIYKCGRLRLAVYIRTCQTENLKKKDQEPNHITAAYVAYIYIYSERNIDIAI